MEDEGIPERYTPYIDIISMIYDEVLGGYINYEDIEMNETAHRIFYYTR